MQKTEWNRGYFRALYGMYLSRKSSATDDYAFFSKIDLTDKVNLHAYRKEFLEHMGNGLHGDFDRGYFSAWADCMRILTEWIFPAPRMAKQLGLKKLKHFEAIRVKRLWAIFYRKAKKNKINSDSHANATWIAV
jgi:hypothetical protein